MFYEMDRNKNWILLFYSVAFGCSMIRALDMVAESVGFDYRPEQEIKPSMWEFNIK